MRQELLLHMALQKVEERLQPRLRQKMHLSGLKIKMILTGQHKSGYPELETGQRLRYGVNQVDKMIFSGTLFLETVVQ